MAVPGKHLHVAIRAYKVARCYPPLQPIPTCSIVEHEMTGVPGRDVAVVPWHVADVYVPATAGAYSSARTTTSQPIRLSRHLMRNGAEQWYWQQGRGGMVCVLYDERE